MSKKDLAALAAFVGILLFVIHALTISDDVQAILEDPNKANKPAEILKLAVDFTPTLAREPQSLPALFWSAALSGIMECEASRPPRGLFSVPLPYRYSADTATCAILPTSRPLERFFKDGKC